MNQDGQGEPSNIESTANEQTKTKKQTNKQTKMKLHHALSASLTPAVYTTLN